VDRPAIGKDSVGRQSAMPVQVGAKATQVVADRREINTALVAGATACSLSHADVGVRRDELASRP
jgi:hypothetical protein